MLISGTFHCGVSNCGGGQCVHKLLNERGPCCGHPMVLVTTNGNKFCSNSDRACDYEETAVNLEVVMHEMKSQSAPGHGRWKQCTKCGATQHSGHYWLGGYKSKEQPPCGSAWAGDWKNNATPENDMSNLTETPAARWREQGEPDPHGDQYNCERAKLCKGDLTDDELANAVYLNPGIGNLTAAKERIRWLSRALVSAQQNGKPADITGDEIACMIADKFSELFDMEGQDYDRLHRLEALGNELSARLAN